MEPRMRCKCYSEGGGGVCFVQGSFFKKKTKPQFYGCKQSAFLLLDKSFIINLRCFCDVFVLAVRYESLHIVKEPVRSPNMSL